MSRLTKSFKIFLLAGSVLALGWAGGPKALAQTRMGSAFGNPPKTPSIEKVRAEMPAGRYQGYHRGYGSSQRWEGSRRPYYHRDWHRPPHHHYHHYRWRWYYYPSWWYGWPGYYYYYYPYYYYPWSPWWYW